MDIFGSIDNAFHAGIGEHGGIYHLIFQRERLVAAEVMANKEKVRRLMPAEYNGLYVVNPLVGEVASYRNVKAETMSILSDNLSRGMEIEKDVDNYVNSNPPGILVMEYAVISRVLFAQGTLYSLPYVEFITGRKKWKFHLNHNNFEKSGKLSEDVFEDYARVLTEAFQEKLEVLRHQ